jgi:hypothetical protein
VLNDNINDAVWGKWRPIKFENYLVYLFRYIIKKMCKPVSAVANIHAKLRTVSFWLRMVLGTRHHEPKSALDDSRHLSLWIIARWLLELTIVIWDNLRGVAFWGSFVKRAAILMRHGCTGGTRVVSIVIRFFSSRPFNYLLGYIFYYSSFFFNSLVQVSTVGL